MSRVAKIGKDYKINYFSGQIKNKGHYLQVEIIENGIVINCENYSEIGNSIEDSFNMTLDDEIFEIKTFIINEDYVIVEVRINDGKI